MATIDTTDEELDAALERLDGELRAAELRHALGALPTAQREAVIGRAVDGVDYPLLAGRAAASEQTVRRRVSRGLHAMRELLEGGRP